MWVRTNQLILFFLNDFSRINSFLDIIEAIVLMTGEYDRNIVYRQEWKKGSQKEIENLDWREAMLYVTTPTVIGK